MLQYCKTILQKVSFNQNLFEKELGKALSYLDPTDRFQFIEWTSRTFGDMAATIIDRYLNGDLKYVLVRSGN